MSEERWELAKAKMRDLDERTPEQMAFIREKFEEAEERKRASVEKRETLLRASPRLRLLDGVVRAWRAGIQGPREDVLAWWSRTSSGTASLQEAKAEVAGVLVGSREEISEHTLARCVALLRIISEAMPYPSPDPLDLLPAGSERVRRAAEVAEVFLT